MKHLLTSTLLLISTQAIAGGSETNPFLNAISFEGEVITIINPIVIIDDDGGTDGGVETKPVLPKPKPYYELFPSAIPSGGNYDDTKWLAPSELEDFKTNPYDVSNKNWSIIVKGGSDTIAVTAKPVSTETPLEMQAIRYVGDSEDSVVLQINNENQLIMLQKNEISKFKNLSGLIQDSANKNSVWVKTH
jgi:hypothetical protein